jgi:hypothetical protein
MHTVTATDGTTLAYDQVGSGPVVIFVAGVLAPTSGRTRSRRRSSICKR